MKCPQRTKSISSVRVLERETQEKSGENPMPQRALAGLLFTAVAFQSRLGVVRPPRTDMVALTARTLEWALFPPQRMDIGLTRFGVQEVGEMRHHRQG